MVLDEITRLDRERQRRFYHLWDNRYIRAKGVQVDGARGKIVVVDVAFGQNTA